MSEGVKPWPSREAMLWSAEALTAVEFVKAKLGDVLQSRALESARQDGRNLITDDDVLGVLQSMAVTVDIEAG